MVAKVRLSTMSEQDYYHFFETTAVEYAAENIQAGFWSAADASERSRKELLKLLPDGVRTKGHRLYSVQDGESGRVIGHLWIKVEESVGGRTGFIYAIYLEQAFRGRGFGKAIMEELDFEAGRLGLRALALHVFSSNPVALHLYERSGYQTRSLNMVKEYPR
jgi:ribosomal protein S18 acetylase RimI-like enzyme